MTDADQVSAVAETLAGAPIDLLINNAGIIDNYGFGVLDGKDDPDIRNYDFDLWERILKTNLLAPARVTGAFVDHLSRGDRRLVVMMTSGLASISNTWQGGRYAYRTSKSALNMLTRGLGAWLEPLGIAVVTIAPGWTQTEMGGANAPNEVAGAIADVRKIVDGLGIEQSGTFWNWDGERLPW